MEKKDLTAEKIFSSAPQQYHAILKPCIDVLGDDVVFMDVSSLSTGELTVYLYAQKAFSMKITQKVSYISCNGSLLKNPLPISPNFSIIGKTDQLRIPIDAFFQQDAFIAAFKEIASFLRKSVSVERFGCCHRFTACSDAKKCLIYDDFDALGCYYRENLEAGRIFYGKNANNGQ